MRMIIYLPQNKHRFALLLVLVLAHCACLANTSVKSDVYRQLYGKSMMQAFAVAQAYETKGDKTKALAAYSAVACRYAADISEPDKRKCADALYHSAEIYYSDRLYSLAMNQYLEALKLSERHSYPLLTTQIYMGIGNLYSSNGDYEMGIRFYKQADSIACSSVKAKVVRNRVLNNLIGATCFVGRISEAEKYLLALQQNKENTPEYHFNELMCKGLILNFKGLHQKALDYYRSALSYAGRNKLGDACLEAVNSCMAQIFLDIHQPDSAIFYLEENADKSVRTGNTDLLAESLHNLSEAYLQKGDVAKAMRYKTRYVELRDSIYSKGEFNAMKNAQFLYEAEANSSKISLLTQEKKNREEMIQMQWRWIFTLILTSLIVIVLMVVLYRQKALLRTAYLELYNRSQEYLNAKPGETAISAAQPDGDGSTHDAEKEVTHLLTTDHRISLLQEIERVMGDTKEYCNSEFGIETLASLVGSNSRYVSAAINEGYGKNFRSFLNEYRIKEAMRRLADVEHYGGYTIKAISESVGYKSQANFISVFTKVTGMKPSIYQKLSKE